MPLPNPSPLKSIAAKAAVGVAVVAAALYAAVLYLDKAQSSRILSIVLVFLAVLIILVIVFWLGRKLYLWFSRRQDARAGAARPGASAQDQAQLDALQAQLDSALRVIRESKLARGRKADEALYALPWILLFGPPESGKTAILRECGVDFPYTTAQGRSPKRSGISLGCDYWFSNGAIVLDPSGRLCTEDEDVETFKGFLQQLKRARRARPLDGVVLTVNLGDFLSQSTEQVASMANRLRQRLDEMTRRMGIRFPVYLVFTKCDQIEGFHAFFGNMRSRDRAQVWGATIARDERKRFSAEQILEREFDRLAASLKSLRLQLLASEKDSAKLHAIFTFPSRFASLKEKLAGFAGTLFQPTSYSEYPIFRGFYLTSAASAPAAGKLQTEAQKEWDPGARRESPEAPPSAARNHFLEKLFPRVVFADRPQATASVDIRLRRRSWVSLAFAGTVLLSALLLIGVNISFVNNLALVRSTRGAIDAVARSAGTRSVPDLQALEDLRKQVEALDQYETQGHSWWELGWFLYSGDRINETARRVYFQRIRDAFAEPSAESLKQSLESFSSASASRANYEQFNNCFNAYLLMTWPSRSLRPFPPEQIPFLQRSLEGIWERGALPEAKRLALQQLDFYTKQMPRNDPELQLNKDKALVKRAYDRLNEAPPASIMFKRLKDEGNQTFPAFKLEQAAGGKILNYLKSRDKDGLPGVFTRDAWNSYFRNAIAQAGKQAETKDYVWESAGLPIPSTQLNENYRQELYKMYFSEYVEAWQRFLDGIFVRALDGQFEARAALEEVAQQDSAIGRLLNSVDANTQLQREPDKSKDAAGPASSAATNPGVAANARPADVISEVAEPFLPLHQLVASTDGGKSPLSQYLASLDRIHSNLEKLFGDVPQWDPIKQYVSPIMTRTSGNDFSLARDLIANTQCNRSPATKPILALLESPLDQTWAAILRETGKILDGQWKSGFADDFSREVSGRFPFNPSGQDLPLETLSRFFKPQGGKLWTFYESELKPFISSADRRYVPVSSMGAHVDFSQSFLDFLTHTDTLKQALFPSGGPEPNVTFDLTPEGTKDVQKSFLDINGLPTLEYGNYAQEATTFTWPGKSGASGAKLTVVPRASRALEEKGEWGLFRLLRKASKLQSSPGRYRVIWAVDDGREVRYILHPQTSPHPFDDNVFKGLICPDRVTQ